MRALLATLCALAAAQPVGYSASGDKLIRIGIVPRADALKFIPAGEYFVADAEGRRHRLTPNKEYSIEAADEHLTMGDLTLPDEVRLTPDKIWAAVEIGPRRYHGTLIVRKLDDDQVSAVEELGIEEYLLGVLPNEMDPDWPLEALKAQAVVARTFAYTQMGKYKKAGFDLTNDTRSQVYGGVGEEKESVRRAVVETKGEVLGYKGQILPVFYHSCCGGHTADQGLVWPSAQRTPPPLRGVRDYYCASAPNARWSVFFTYGQILEALQKKHMIGGALRRFEIGRRSALGYVRDFIVKIGDKTQTVKANDFRLAVGPAQLKSARISRIKKRDGGIEFFGGGSGHGVGLCQWGARIQAERGRGYEQILKFYFPGSVLSVIDE